MPAPVTKRRPGDQQTKRPLAAPRKNPNRTLRTGFVKGSRELAAHRDELSRQLDALHAEGIWTGPRHAALCEAVLVVQRGLQSVRRAVELRREKGRAYTVRRRTGKRQRFAESRRVA